MHYSAVVSRPFMEVKMAAMTSKLFISLSYCKNIPSMLCFTALRRSKVLFMTF